MNTLIPAIRRGIGRARIAGGRPLSGPSPRGTATAPTLSRSEFRQAVIEVLG